MAIFQDKDKFIEWRYIIKKVTLLFKDGPEKSYSIPIERIKALEWEENYDDYYFPLLTLHTVLSSDEITKICQYRKDLKIHLCIVSNTREKGKEAWSDKESKFLDEKFDIVLNSADEDMISSMIEEKNKNDLKKKKPEAEPLASEQFSDFSLFLFKHIIGGVKAVVNKVFKNVTIADVVTYIMGVAGVKKLYFAQPNNNKRYKELLIPPLSILRAYEFIDMYYGIYKFGSLIWFGFNKTYITPYSSECKVWDKKEKKTTNIIIPKGPNSKVGDFTGELRRKKKDVNNNYIVGLYQSLGIVDNSVSNDYITSNEIEAINTSGEGTTRAKPSKKKLGKDKNYVQLLEDYTENKWVSETYAMQALSESQMMQIDVGSYDLRVISPNKKYNVMFEDNKFVKKYNGGYIASSVVHTFVKSDTNILTPMSRILLKRLK